MDAEKNIPASSPRAPRRLTIVAGALLLALLISIHAAPSASAAATEVTSEVTAAANSVAEPVMTPPPSSANPPPPPTPAPAPVPTPAVAETVNRVVEHSLGGGSATGNQVIREATHQSTATVDAVAEKGGVAPAPIVEDAVRRGGETASSLVNAATTAAAEPARQSAHDQGVGEQPASPGTAEPVGLEKPVGSPSPPSPRSADTAFAWSWSVPLAEIHTKPPEDVSGSPTVPTNLHWATNAPASALPSSTGRNTGWTSPALPANAPALPPLVATSSASTSLGGESGSSLLLLGLLAIFVLVAPRSPLRLLAAGTRYRPASLICALERPG